MKDMVPFRGPRGLTSMDLFNDFFRRDFMESFLSSNIFPESIQGGFCADIKDKENEYIVEAELPGIKKEDIEIDLLDNRLTISAKQDEEVNEEKENYIRRERRIGKVSRSFMVSGIDNENVKAKFTDGLLEIVLPKEKEYKSRDTRIDIE